MLFFLALVVLSSVQASPVDRRLASTDSAFQNTMQVCGAIAGMVPLILMHLSIRTAGFKLTRSFGGTDLAMWLLLGLSAAVWSTLVLLSAFLYQDSPCSPYNKWACLGRLAYVPWILIVMFCVWVGAVVNHLVRHSKEQEKNGELLGETSDFRVPLGEHLFKVSKIRLLSTLAFAPIVLTTSIGAFKDGQYTISVLNIVGAIIVLLFSFYRMDIYYDSPHKYAADNIRIPLATELDPSIVYILPSKNRGFDAIYSRRLESEYAARDKAKDLELYYSGPKKRKEWKEGEEQKKAEEMEKEAYAMRRLIADHSRNIAPLTFEEVKFLAEWLCGRHPNHAQNFRRRRKVSLIGRELMMALLHCEKLVFRMKRKLKPDLRKQISELRPMEREREDAFDLCATVTDPISISSAGSRNGEKEEEQKPGHAEESPTKGWDGFCKAAKRVYDIFGMPFKIETELDFGDGDQHAQIVQLWDACFDVDQSTFGALYLWSSAWYIENGNGNRYDIEPFVPNRKDHCVSSWSDWLISWRDIWFVAVFSQLMSMLPTVLSSFLGAGLV